jgi:hypothetical protein
MGTFAETAIIDYRFLFADPRTTNFRFPFSFAANRQKFAVSAVCKRTKLPFSFNSVFRMYTYMLPFQYTVDKYGKRNYIFIVPLFSDFRFSYICTYTVYAAV